MNTSEVDEKSCNQIDVEISSHMKLCQKCIFCSSCHKYNEKKTYAVESTESLNNNYQLSMCGLLQCDSVYQPKSNYLKEISSKCCLVSVSFKVVIGLLIFLIFLLLISYQSYYKQPSISNILSFLEHQSIWYSIVFFTFAFTIVSFPIMWGYLILNVAAGYFHGFLGGLALVIFSVICGTLLSHLIYKHYFSVYAIEWLKTKDNYPKIQGILKILDGSSGMRIIGLLRLTPIPFGFQNSLIAVSNVPIRQYIIASTIGLLPTQALNCYIGSKFRSVQELSNSNVPGGYYILAVQLFFGVLLSRIVVNRARKELDSVVAKDIPDQIQTETKERQEPECVVQIQPVKPDDIV